MMLETAKKLAAAMLLLRMEVLFRALYQRAKSLLLISSQPLTSFEHLDEVHLGEGDGLVLSAVAAGSRRRGSASGSEGPTV